jgi:2,4-dienoyl-CoA reductase-like NADH-dependent reductase (Old Yellow Enzyme family)
VRQALPDRLLTYNFSLYKMDDITYQPSGGAEEVGSIARALRDAGVDVLHVTTRRVLRAEPFGETLARVVCRAVPADAVIVNGGIRSLEDAEAALRQTGAAFVALARALLANPDWIHRATACLPMATYQAGMEAQPGSPP